jgi:hypothetical protein
LKHKGNGSFLYNYYHSFNNETLVTFLFTHRQVQSRGILNRVPGPWGKRSCAIRLTIEKYLEVFSTTSLRWKARVARREGATVELRMGHRVNLKSEHEQKPGIGTRTMQRAAESIRVDRRRSGDFRPWGRQYFGVQRCTAAPWSSQGNRSKRFWWAGVFERCLDAVPGRLEPIPWYPQKGSSSGTIQREVPRLHPHSY